MKIIIILLMVVTPALITYSVKLFRTIRIIRSMEKKAFVCPNCGYHIWPSRRKLFFERFRYGLYYQIKLKCPNCNTVDMFSQARD